MMTYITIDDVSIPVQVIIEARRGARVSLGGKHVILRIPQRPFFAPDIDQHIDWATGWLRQLKAKKPHVLHRFLNKRQYTDGDIIAMGGIDFRLQIEELPRPNGTIRFMKPDRLHLLLPDSPGYDSQKLIKKLLIIFSQKYFLPHITRKVDYYNRQYFQKEVQNVRLKYNTSNWGSCSHGKNLNFSVRLFLAPEAVLDYVVVHELAHLIEMNHSPRFWQLVEAVMPDFRKQEALLKINSALYDF